MPAPLLYDKTLPPVVRDTWARLRGLAWGKDETPPLSLDQICELLGIGQSTLYGHMLILRQRAALQWRAAGNKTLIVSFADCPADLSRNLEKPTPFIKPKTKPLKPEGGALQKSGESKKLESGPPAVEVFREVTRLYPDKSLFEMIEQGVGGQSENLERWGATVRGWLAAGYSKKNIAGMLDWFKHGRTTREHTNGTHPNRPPQGRAEPVPHKSEEQRERDRQLRTERDARRAKRTGG